MAASSFADSANCSFSFATNFGILEQTARSEGVALAEAPSRLLPLPPPWTGRELVLRADSSLGGVATYRVVLFARTVGPGLVASGSLRIPELLAEDNAPVLGRILASLELVALPSAP